MDLLLELTHGLSQIFFPSFELIARHRGGLQLLYHLVKSMGQVLEFVVVGDVNPVCEVTACHALQAYHELSNRPQEQPNQEHCGDDRRYRIKRHEILHQRQDMLDGLLRMEARGLEILACEHLHLLIQELIYQHAQVNKPLPCLAYFIVEPQYRPNLVLDLRHRTPDGLADHLPVIRSLPQGRVFCQLAFDITELGKK